MVTVVSWKEHAQGVVAIQLQPTVVAREMGFYCCSSDFSEKPTSNFLDEKFILNVAKYLDKLSDLGLW